jgi:hypothetical protein
MASSSHVRTSVETAPNMEGMSVAVFVFWREQ